MLALERYSENECSLLLSRSPRDVIKAQDRAFQQRKSAMEFKVNQQVSVGPEKHGLHNNCGSALEDFLRV
jgi:hypothetical protein